MISPPRQKPSRGFLLLEVVLALAVFSIAATGFAVALNRMGKAADLAQRELRLTRLLDSALDEAMSMPALTLGTSTVTDSTSGIDLVTKVEQLENLLNEDGQTLQDMFSVSVTAHWYEAGQWQNRTVETWRYGRMYQP